MRFEIKSGGMAAILTSIAALSGAVFMLGLLAGYDVGRESQSGAAQVATAYPVAAPPSDAGGAPATGASPPPSAVASPRPAAHAVSSSPAPPAIKVATAKPVAAKPPKAIARATAPRAVDQHVRSTNDTAPPTGEVGTPAEGSDTGEEEGGGAERRPAPSATPRPVAHADGGAGAPGVMPHHKPFNIQIEAAMDRNGAGQMARRLQALGYQPHLVPAQMNGQTWYKVVIGPYPTQEAAAAAQHEMRAKYNNIYGGAGTGEGSSGSTD